MEKKEVFINEFKTQILEDLVKENKFIHDDYKELIVYSKLIDIKFKGMYCAIPSRIRTKDKKIMKYVYEKLNLAPFSPFGIMNFEYWEAGIGGRKAALKGTRLNLLLYSHTGLFGISEGACGDAELALLCEKQLEFYFKKFDEEWKNYLCKIMDINGKKEHLLPKNGGTGRFYNLYQAIKNSFPKLKFE
jgi:hypothetical protein